MPIRNALKLVVSWRSERLWDEHNVIHLQLRENMRVKNNALATQRGDHEFEKQLLDYEQWLFDLGEGKLTKAPSEYF
jgi:hypothetical protein